LGASKVVERVPYVGAVCRRWRRCLLPGHRCLGVVGPSALLDPLADNPLQRDALVHVDLGIRDVRRRHLRRRRQGETCCWGRVLLDV